MEGKEKETPKLPEDVAKKYQVLPGHGVGEYHWSGHRVNLQHISLEHADRLVSTGFPYLVQKEKETEKKAALPAKTTA